MTSPETPPPAPPRSALVVGDGSWKAIVPVATVLGIFLGVLAGMIAYFDNRFTVGFAGLRTELAATEQRLTERLTDRIDGVEKRLTDRIDQVETGLNARIDRVEKRLSDRIDRVEDGLGTRIDEVKAELAAGEARRAAMEERLSSGIERNAVGVAENRAAHRELAGFVRAGPSREPPPAAASPGSAPAQ